MKPSLQRDRPCAYVGCEQLVRRTSTYCRHHLGVLHGAASARTFTCSEVCQQKHVRCARCRCLCEGSHARRLRDGVCYVAGAPSCWSQLRGAPQDLALFVLTCLMCARPSTWVVLPPPRLMRCRYCGGSLLEAEVSRVTAGLRLLPGSGVHSEGEGRGRVVS